MSDFEIDGNDNKTCMNLIRFLAEEGASWPKYRRAFYLLHNHNKCLYEHCCKRHQESVKKHGKQLKLFHYEDTTPFTQSKVV